MFKGLGSSSGIAIGQAYVLPAWEWNFQEKEQENHEVLDMAREFERLYDGIRHSKFELNQMKKEISELLGYEESNIFDAHLAILEDPIFMKEVHSLIQQQFKAAEIAVKEVIDRFSDMFAMLDDEYMKERAVDIRDVGHRLIKHLLGTSQEEISPPTDHPYIAVAKEITPSQLAHLDQSNILGIVTMIGGPTSHTAIMARALGVPYVSGIDDRLTQSIQSGDLLVIDGDEGVVYTNPDQVIINRYRHRQTYQNEQWEKLWEIVDDKAVSMDGMAFRLSANISSIKELEQITKFGAEGVGLFRTEFLYMDRDNFPDEEEQFAVYKQVAEHLDSRPLVIRTFDIGGDKQLDYLPLPDEDNPFLGYRAIRISLDQPELFKIQLRAILRSSQFGNVKIMYPMISSIKEVRKANSILEEAKQELRQRKEPFNESIQVGIMIEIPAAVAIADLLAQEVDFFSIGTNDLIQYVIAVDRMNDHIAKLYEPFHPAIFRMLQQTVDAAIGAGIPVSVCGELAGDPMAVPIWMALGIQDLSMSVQSLLRVKRIILDSRAEVCKQSVKELKACRTSDEVSECLKHIFESMQKQWEGE